MKLWVATVTIEVEAPIWAETPEDAQALAEKHRREIISDAGMYPDVYVHYKSLDEAGVLAHAFEDSLAYGSDDDRTCLQLVTEDAVDAAG